LSVLPLEERGEHFSYVHTTADGVTDVMAVLWVDRERRYFISSTSTTLPGMPYDRVRWWQVGDDAERVVVTVAQPQVVETYYPCRAQIDRHNRCLQDDFQLEHKLIAHEWSMRVNQGLSDQRFRATIRYNLWLSESTPDLFFDTGSIPY